MSWPLNLGAGFITRLVPVPVEPNKPGELRDVGS